MCTIHQIFENVVNGISLPPKVEVALATPAISSEAVAEVSATFVCKAKKARKVAPQPLAKTAVRHVAVFVGGLNAEVTNDQIQANFRTDALVGRFHLKLKIGHAKVLVPEHQLDQALSQKSAFGCNIRVAKWNATIAGSQWAKKPASHGRRQVYAVDKTAGACMETSVCDSVRRLLEHFTKPRRK